MFIGDFFSDARAKNMVDTIVDNNLDVEIIDTGGGESIYRNKKIHHISLPNSGIYRYIKFYIKSKKIIKTIKPKCIISGDLYSLPSASSYRPKKLIYDSREIYTQLAGLKGRPFKQKFWSQIEKLFIYKASSILVTAESDAEVIKSIYGPVMCLTIKNFPSKYNLQPHPKSLARILGINKKTPIFLYQGMIYKGRGIEQVFNLLNSFSSAHYVILGQGHYREKLEQRARELDIANRVHFLGKIPYSQLLSYTATATIGFSLIEPVTKSYEHALPNKVFEYAAVGLPVVATNLPEMKRAVKEYSLGYCVDFGDQEGLKSVVEKILNTGRTENFIPNPNILWESQAEIFVSVL